MLDTSKEFQQAIRKNTKCCIVGYLFLANGKKMPLESKDFMAQSTRFEQATSASSAFEVGAAITGTFNFKLNNSDEKFSGIDMTGAVIQPIITKTLSNSVERIVKGWYNIEKPTSIGRTIEVSAYDNMIKFGWYQYKDVGINYPASVKDIIKKVCNHCGVELESDTFDNSNYMVQSCTNEEAMTCADIISALTQITGNYARINVYGRLELKWYDTTYMGECGWDGGTFKTLTTPYSDGDNADGGDFNNYTAGDNADGGNFTDDQPYRIYAFASKKINVDEVIVTGVKVIVDTENTCMKGNDAYVITIENNPLITKQNMSDITNMIASKVIGMHFRPFSATALCNPALEAGDPVLLYADGNPYFSYVTRIAYKLGNYETYECSSQSASINKGISYSAQTKNEYKIKNEAKKQATKQVTQLSRLNDLMIQSLGLYRTEDKQPDGSVIYYMHDKATLESSRTIWKMIADAFAVSTDGGKTWNAGMDKDGNATVNVLSAVGINFDWASGGTLGLGGKDNGNGQLVVRDSNDKPIVTIDNAGIKLSEDASLEWNNKVAEITKDAVTVDYINSLKVKAGSVDAENVTGNAIHGIKFLTKSRQKIAEDVIGLYIGDDGLDYCWDASNEWESNAYGHFRIQNRSMTIIVGGDVIFRADAKGRHLGENVGHHVTIPTLVCDTFLKGSE